MRRDRQTQTTHRPVSPAELIRSKCSERVCLPKQGEEGKTETPDVDLWLLHLHIHEHEYKHILSYTQRVCLNMESSSEVGENEKGEDSRRGRDGPM